jgi:hypothetical protein
MSPVKESHNWLNDLDMRIKDIGLCTLKRNDESVNSFNSKEATREMVEIQTLFHVLAKPKHDDLGLGSPNFISP